MGRSAYERAALDKDCGSTFEPQPNEEDLARTIARYLPNQEPEFRARTLVEVTVVTKNGKHLSSIAVTREQAMHNLLTRVVREE